MSIYQDIILYHYHSPRNNNLLVSPTHSTKVDNPLCGDEITMQIEAKHDTISDIGFEAKGCAISIASASLLSEQVKGKKIQEIVQLTKENVMELLGIELGPNRMKCALLPLEALSKLIKSIKK